jgi:preprotein translocase subunit SecG
MLTIALLLMGFIVVVGLVFLVLRSGTQGGRHGQSGVSAARAQRQSAARATGVRGSGRGDD